VLKGLHQPAWGFDLEQRPEMGKASVVEGVAVARTGLPVGLDVQPEVFFGEFRADDRLPQFFGAGTNVKFVDVPGYHLACLHFLLESRHRLDPRLGELADPAVEDQANRDRIEIVKFLATGAAGGDQPGFLEHPQVLHHAEPGHLW
jgi:hypothetical protein